MSQVSAISGAVGKDFDALRNKALEMGAKTQFSASEAADAMTYMGMAGWKAGDMINGIEGIMDLAAASGEDLATTSDIVTDALTAFGLQAGDSGHFADILAVASSNANTNVGMMGETFKYVAPIAGAMGYSAEDTALAIGLMANSGIKASQAGTSLRSIITRLAKPTKDSAKAMDALGISVTDSSGNMKPLNEIIGDMRVGFSGLTESEKASYAAMLAGQEAMSGLLAIVGAAPADVEKLTSAIDNCNGAAKEMSKTMMDNLAGDVKLFKSALESLQITVSDTLKPTLREFTQFGTKAMEQLTMGFQNGGMNGFFSALTGVITQAVTFLSEQAPKFAEASMRFIQSMADGILNARDKIIDSANQIFNMLMNGLDSWLSANVSKLVDFGKQIVDSLFQGFVSAGEIISKYIGEFIPLIAEAFLRYHEALFTVGIDILGAIAKGIVENKDKITEIASTTIRNIALGLAQHAPEIIDGAIALLNALVDAFMQNMPLILAVGTEIVAKIVAGISTNMPALIAVVALMSGEILKIVKVVGDVVNAFGAIGGAISKLGGVVEPVLSALSGAFSALWGVIAAHPVVAVVAAIIAAIVLLWNKCDAFREFWIGVWDKCKEGFGAFADWCKEGVETLKAKFAEWRESINEKFQDIGNWFKEKWNAVKESASDAADTAKKKFDEFRKAIDDKFGKIHDWFGEKFSAARKNIESAWDGITGFFEGILQKILGIFKMSPEEFKSIGTNIIKGFADGILSKAEWLYNKAKGVVDKIKSVFTNAKGFDVHSPSRWAKRVGANVMEGAANGFLSGTRKLIAVARSAVENVKDNLALDPLSVDTEDGVFVEYLQTLREKFTLLLEDVQESITNFGEWLTGSINTFFEWFTGILTTISESVTDIQTSFQEIWAGIVETWGTAPEWFGEICESIRLVFETLTAAIVELFTAAVTAIQEVFASLQEAFRAVCDVLQEIWTQASTFFTETFIAAVDAIKEAWATVQDFFQEIWDAIASIFEVAPQWFGETFAAALEALQEAFDPVIDYFTTTWENIIAVFGDALERFAEVGANIITGLQDGIESGRDVLLQLMGDIKQALLDIVNSLTDELNNVVTDAMQQLSESVSSAVSEMKSQVDELISKIAEALSKLENAKAKTKALEEQAKSAEKAAEKKAEQASKATQKAVETAQSVVNTAKIVVNKVKTSALPTVKTNKTPSQIQREEKTLYGKSQKTPSQINRQDKTTKKTNPNGYVSTSILRQTQKTLTTSQINRLDKQMAKGVGFGGGGASGTGAGRTSTANLTPSQIQRMEKTGYGNTYVTINSPKAMNEAEAARQFKKASQQLALGY